MKPKTSVHKSTKATVFKIVKVRVLIDMRGGENSLHCCVCFAVFMY